MVTCLGCRVNSVPARALSKDCLETVAITQKRTVLRSIGSPLYCSLHLCRRDACSPMLTTVPSTITKIWNQPRSHRCVCGFRKLLTHGEENKGERSCFSLLLWKETRLGLDFLSYLLRFLGGIQDSWKLAGRSFYRGESYIPTDSQCLCHTLSSGIFAN